MCALGPKRLRCHSWLPWGGKPIHEGNAIKSEHFVRPRIHFYPVRSLHNHPIKLARYLAHDTYVMPLGEFFGGGAMSPTLGRGMHHAIVGEEQADVLEHA